MVVLVLEAGLVRVPVRVHPIAVAVLVLVLDVLVLVTGVGMAVDHVAVAVLVAVGVLRGRGRARASGLASGAASARAQSAQWPCSGKWVKRTWYPNRRRTVARTGSSASAATLVTRPQRSQARYSRSPSRART